VNLQSITSIINYRERRTLKFRPVYDFNSALEEQEDLGYRFKMPGKIKVIQRTLIDNGFVETDKKGWAIWWNIGRVPTKSMRALKSFQRVNYFPKSIEITRKDKMFKNLIKMKNKFGEEFSFVPQTFLLPDDLINLMKDSEKKKNGTKQVYICKPNGSSQGRGIYLTENVQEVRLL